MQQVQREVIRHVEIVRHVLAQLLAKRDGFLPATDPAQHGSKVLAGLDIVGLTVQRLAEHCNRVLGPPFLQGAPKVVPHGGLLGAKLAGSVQDQR